jgi:hypothetical protein
LQVADSAIPTAEAASEDLHNVAASVGKVRQDQEFLDVFMQHHSSHQCCAVVMCVCVGIY